MTDPRKTPIHEVHFAAGTDPNYGGQQLHKVVLLEDYLRETQELAEALASYAERDRQAHYHAMGIGTLTEDGERYSKAYAALARHRAKQEGSK